MHRRVRKGRIKFNIDSETCLDELNVTVLFSLYRGMILGTFQVLALIRVTVNNNNAKEKRKNPGNNLNRFKTYSFLSQVVCCFLK